MQKSTWLRAAVLLVAVALTVPYNTGVGLGSWFGVFFLLECKVGLAFSEFFFYLTEYEPG